MRQIINISLPEETVKMIKAEVKAGGYASVSEFMRHLIRLWNTKKLLNDVKAAKKAFKAGNWKEFTSFKDLE